MCVTGIVCQNPLVIIVSYKEVSYQEMVSYRKGYLFFLRVDVPVTPIPITKLLQIGKTWS